MTLEFVYWLTLGVGLGMLLLSVLLGDVLDFFDLDLGGSEFAAGPVFFAAIAAFGAGGLLGIRAFGWGPGGSIVFGIATGMGFGGATAVFFALLKKQEATGAFDLRSLIGERGQCSVALAPGQVGRVTVLADGMTRSFPARSSEEIAVGEDVVVQDVVGSQLTVARQSATA